MTSMSGSQPGGSTFDSHSGYLLEYIVLGHPKLKTVNNQWVASCQLGFLIPKILYLDCLFQIYILCGLPVNS